jgi:hypothetical protein
VKQKHKFENYFECVDTEEKAYWLGFLYADGCNLPDYNRFVVSLSDKDINHLYKFCDFLGIDRKNAKFEKHREINIKGRKINGESCRVTACSKHASECLKNLGMIKNKSLVLKFPSSSIIGDDLMRHFVRGFFDGDGCITKTEYKNVTRYRIIFVSTEKFCNGLIDVIKPMVNIKLWTKRNNVNVWLCCISGNNQINKFLKWIYDGAHIYLDRKYDRYLKFLDKINLINFKVAAKSSKYNNIVFDKSRNKWIAKIRINKKTKYVGRFDTEELAKKAQKDFIKKFSN